MWTELQSVQLILEIWVQAAALIRTPAAQLLDQCLPSLINSCAWYDAVDYSWASSYCLEHIAMRHLAIVPCKAHESICHPQPKWSLYWVYIKTDGIFWKTVCLTLLHGFNDAFSYDVAMAAKKVNCFPKRHNQILDGWVHESLGGESASPTALENALRLLRSAPKLMRAIFLPKFTQRIYGLHKKESSLILGWYVVNLGLGWVEQINCG